MAGSYVIQCYENASSQVLTSFGPTGFLYNDKQHLRTQADGPFLHFCVIDNQTAQPVARCTFFRKADGWYSPLSAPFGSVECTVLLPDAVLDALLDQIGTVLNREPGTVILIKHPPHCYAPEQAEHFIERLLKRNVRIVSAAQTYYLPVITEALCTRMAGQERRRLRKAERAGFVFRRLTDPDPEQIITYWQQRRQEQQYPLTIAPEQLRRLLTELPDRFPVFVVKADNHWAAMSICVRVSATILYHFLPVDQQPYRPFSPMVMLIDGLYRYCQAEGISVLDLGVSLDADRFPKPDLARFKRNMGALTSPVLSFEWRL